MVSSTLQVDGMTCTGRERRVHDAVMAVEGVVSVIVSHVKGEVSVDADATGQGLLIKAITDAGYAVKGEDAPPPASFTWRNGTTWRRSAHNTTWCLAGCAIGEFGTLATYSITGITAGLAIGSTMWILFAILPLINGLITSMMLETGLLIRRESMAFGTALSTAFGMSFLSMLMMEISMEVTDLIFTNGELGLDWRAIPFMLMAGFLTPWPYNYYRLERHGASCH